MRTTARADRLGLLLALVLVLLGVSAATAPDNGNTGQRQASQGATALLGESVSAAASMNDDLHDWLRLSMAARFAPAQAEPDSWWAVRPREAGGRPLRGRSPVDGFGGAGLATVEPPPRSSRGPPFA
ncbi:hypothetical protein [Saccharothrix sp. HUAS TT1]|uniref:hypothetical protein n=1 Tax=unclassified Saccharothrix TaxID=2593673 RepID=UPI00345BF8C3